MITLHNGKISVLIDEFGAEIKSVIKDGREYMWQGEPQIWSGTAPTMFPICGGLKDDKFIYGGIEYKLPKHGFARRKMFTLEQADNESAVLLLKSDDETKAMYPFDFEFRIIYTISGDAVTVAYRVDNVGDNTMYFSIGSHEGYYTPEGVEDYDIIFPEKETLNSVMVDGTLLQDHTLPIIKDSNVLALYDKYFLVDCLLFKTLKSRSAVLRNRKTGKSIRIEFPDAPYFVVWHPHGAPFICIEPWAGIPDDHHSTYDLSKKEGIISLSAGQTYRATHTLTFLGE